MTAGTADPGSDRSWPVDGPAGIRPTVLRGWEPPPAPWAAGHRGVDLASSDGAIVKAAAPGRITFAGTVAGRGVLTLEITGSGRPPLHTTYEPVRATVRKGQQVTAGQPVAVLEGGPYHCRAPCLHWGLRRGTTYLDPLSLLPPAALGNGPSRLLPVFGIPEPKAAPEPGPERPARERPTPAAHRGTEAPTDVNGATLTGALALGCTALWAIGRLRGGAGGAGWAFRRTSRRRRSGQQREPHGEGPVARKKEGENREVLSRPKGAAGWGAGSA